MKYNADKKAHFANIHLQFVSKSENYIDTTSNPIVDY